MSLTLPLEYEEINRQHRLIPYEIRAKPPGCSKEDECLVMVFAEEDGTFLVQYWPEETEEWHTYAKVNSLEEAIEMCKVIVLMGITTFLPQGKKNE